MAYSADARNLLDVNSSVNLPLMSGWYSFNGSVTTAQRPGNGDGSLTLEGSDSIQLYSHPVPSAGYLPTGIPVTGGLPYTFSVAVVGASTAGNSNWKLFIKWIDSTGTAISTITVSTETVLGTKIRIPLSGVAPDTATHAVIVVTTDRACILRDATFAQSETDLGPLPPSYNGSRWIANPDNKIPVSPVDGRFATMEGWVASDYVSRFSAGGDGILDISSSSRASIAFKESSSTSTTLGIPVFPSTTYTFGVTEGSFSGLSAAAYLIRKETNGDRTLIPMTYSSNGRWSATATSTAGQGFAIQISTLYGSGPISHPTFVAGTTDPGPLDPILFNGSYQRNSTNLVPVDSLTGGFARMKNWKTALGDSVVDNGDNTDTITPGLVPVAVDNGDGTFSITPIPQGAVDNGDGTFTIYSQYSPVLPDNNDGTASLSVGTTAYLINPDETYVLTGVNGSVTAGITLAGSSAGTAATINVKVYNFSGNTQLATYSVPTNSTRRSLTFTSPPNSGYLIIDASTSTSVSQLSHPVLVLGSTDPGPLDPRVSGTVSKVFQVSYANRVLAKKTTNINFTDRILVRNTFGVKYFDTINVNKVWTSSSVIRHTISKLFTANWNDYISSAQKVFILESSNRTKLANVVNILWADRIKAGTKTGTLTWTDRIAVGTIFGLAYPIHQIVTSGGTPIPAPITPSPSNPANTKVQVIQSAIRQTVGISFTSQWVLGDPPPATVVNRAFGVSFSNNEAVRTSASLQWANLITTPVVNQPIDPKVENLSWSNRETVRMTFGASWANVPLDSGAVVAKTFALQSVSRGTVAISENLEWSNISVFGGIPGQAKSFSVDWSNRTTVRKTFSVNYPLAIPVRKTLQLQYNDNAHVHSATIIEWMDTEKVNNALTIIWGNIPSRSYYRVSPGVFSESTPTSIGRIDSFSLDSDGKIGINA